MRNSNERAEFLQTFAVAMAAMAPFYALSIGLNLYGKNRGRDMSVGRKRRGDWGDREPFAEPRLNEFLAMARRVGITVGFLVFMGVLVLESYISNENVTLGLAIAVGLGLGGMRGLIIQACLAFGAELAPEPENTLARVPGI